MQIHLVRHSPTPTPTRTSPAKSVNSISAFISSSASCSHCFRLDFELTVYKSRNLQRPVWNRDIFHPKRGNLQQDQHHWRLEKESPIERRLISNPNYRQLGEPTNYKASTHPPLRLSTLSRPQSFLLPLIPLTLKEEVKAKSPYSLTRAE